MIPDPVPVRMAAIGVLRDESHVVMVESKYGDRPPFWALPGGFLEAGETIEDGLVREVREESGLEATGPISVVAVIWFLGSAAEPLHITFVCEPTGWSGTPRPDGDPDGVTIAAELVPVDEAIHRLGALPWGTGEPVVHHLRGGAPGGMWVYRRSDDDGGLFGGAWVPDR